MVKLTRLSDLTKYFDVPKEAVDFLLSVTDATENKKYVFSDKCYINVQNCDTKNETPLMEAHEKFVDVQCLINGEEKIYYAKKDGIAVKQEYSEKSDCAFYEFFENSDEAVYKSGEGIILYPEEAHLPNRAVNEPTTIKKAVLKIHTDLMKA